MDSETKYSSRHHYLMAMRLVQNAQTHNTGMAVADIQCLLQVAQVHASLFAGRVVEEQTERLKHG